MTSSRGVVSWLALSVGTVAVIIELVNCSSLERVVETREIVLRDRTGNVRLRATAAGDDVRLEFFGNGDTSLELGVGRDQVLFSGETDKGTSGIHLIAEPSEAVIALADGEASARFGASMLSFKNANGYSRFGVDLLGPVLLGASPKFGSRFELKSGRTLGSRLSLVSPRSYFDSVTNDDMANLKVGWGDVSTDVRGDEARSVAIYSTQRASSIALRSNERRVRVSDGDEGEILLVSGPKGRMFMDRHPDAKTKK